MDIPIAFFLKSKITLKSHVKTNWLFKKIITCIRNKVPLSRQPIIVELKVARNPLPTILKSLVKKMSI